MPLAFALAAIAATLSEPLSPHPPCNTQDAGEVRVWDARSGALLSSLESHTGWVRCVAWSLDDSKVASCSEDRTIHLWDAK